MGELMTLFSDRVQYVIGIIWRISAVLVFGIVSISAVISTSRNLYSTTEALELPYLIFFFPTIVGFILVTIQYFIILIEFIKNKDI